MSEEAFIKELLDLLRTFHGGASQQHNYKYRLFKLFENAYADPETRKILTLDVLCFALGKRVDENEPRYTELKESIKQSSFMMSEWKYAWDRYRQVGQH